MDALILLVSSIAAGFLGAILGLGGGIIVIPTVTLLLHVDIRYAIAASLVSIVATSSGAAASFLKDHLTNLRLAVLLEIGTVLGAITGFLIAAHVDASRLFLLFGLVLMFSALMMLRKKGDSRAVANHPWATALKLDDEVTLNGRTERYFVANVPFGLAVMYLAGILSALLGIGSGIFKVLAMDNAMKLPMKVSSATSNFMIGVTATASAGAYLLRGDVRPELAGPISVGIIGGSWLGARVMPHLPADAIRRVFVVVLVLTSVQMIAKGW